MITIHNLEVRFDVEGDDDRQQFARLFNEFIRQWAERANDEQCREQAAADERSLGDRPPGGPVGW